MDLTVVDKEGKFKVVDFVAHRVKVLCPTCLRSVNMTYERGTFSTRTNVKTNKVTLPLLV